MRFTIATCLAMLAAMGILTATAAEDDAALRKDLTAVIALQGLACGEVTGVVRQGDRDYIATCKDGNRYHVFVDAQGRVVAKKQ